MNVSSWFRNWLVARRATAPTSIALNHSARLSLRKLEDRQVLSVSASFLGGVLDVAIDGGTDSDPQHVDNTNDVTITVDASNHVFVNSMLVDSDYGLAGVQPLDAVNVSSINVHDVAGAANTIDLSGVSFASGFTHAGGVSVTLNGGAGADTITGSGFDDLIIGGAGNDSLRGGGGNDVYQFQDGFGVDTVIDTGGAADSLDFSLVTSDVTVNLQTHKATIGTNSVNFAVAEIDSVVGHSGGNDTFQGLNAISNWDIGATGTDYTSAGSAIHASGFETLQGGSLVDTFHVGADGNWTLKGGAGADVFDIDATFSGTLDGQTDSDTLQGTNGVIVGPVTIATGDRLSPGNSPGILSTGNLAFANSSNFVVEIKDTNNTATPGGTAGTDYDQMQVAGTVTIGTGVTLTLQDLGSTQAKARDVYTIISNDGVDAVTGTFSGLANGAVVAAIGGINYRIYYNGGDGNDVVLIGRPAALTHVFVSNSFVGMIPGAIITDVDFITAGDQAGLYGIDGYATMAEAIAGVDAGGTVHVNSGTYLHTGTLAVNKSVTIDGQGMTETNILKSGAPTGNFDEAIRISADNVTISDVKLGWQTHSSLVFNAVIDYKGYVVVTKADNTTINHVLFGSNITGEGYRSAVVFEGAGANGADGLEVSDSIFEGRWGRAAIRDGDNGSGQNFLITRNEFREDHYRWGPIAIGPQDSAGTPNNFAFSGEISFNYFGNGLDAVSFESEGNQNYTVTITNKGLTAAGLDILHNTFDWNDANVTNQVGVYAQPAGVYIAPTLIANTDQILIQDNIFNNFAYGVAPPSTTDPLWKPTDGVFGGALEFDGVDDYGVWQSPLFDVGTTGTLNFWVQLEDTSSRSQFFEGPDNSGLEFQYRNNGSGQIYGRTSDNGDYVIRSGNDNAILNSGDGWHNIQYTWDKNATDAAGKMHIYVDGVESSYLSGFTPNNLAWTTVVSTVNGVMSIGRDPGTSGRNFDGSMDDVGWFNSVLTAAELAQIRDTSGPGVASLASDPRLVAHWDFDQATGDTAVDNKNVIVMQLSTGIVPSGYGVVTPTAAVVVNNVFYNEIAGTYADSNQPLDSSNIIGPTANPFFNGDQAGYSGTTLEDFYTLRFGSSAAYQSTEFDASIATDIPHIGANQENPVAIGTEDILVVGSDFDDLVVVTFTSDNAGYFSYTRDVTGATPDYVGTFYFTDITSFTFDGYGGDDVFIIIQPTAAQGGLYSLVNGITFHGGLEFNNGNALSSDSSTGGDTLVLLQSATDVAVLDSVAYLFGDETSEGYAGTITLSDATYSTVITFTGTEPIRDELSVDARTFTFASMVGGGNETITVSTSGDTVAMTPISLYQPEVTSRTLDNRITSTLGPNVSFNTPHTLLDINAGIGDDTINVNAIHANYRAELSISGGDGFDTVNLNTNLTLGDANLGNTGDLTVTSETINVNADIATSGTGDISLIASRNVSLTSGSSLTTVDGDMLVQANQQATPTAGNFIGIDIDNAVIQSTGTGTVTVKGRGGDASSGSQIGVQVRSGGDVIGGTMGQLTVQGTGGDSSGDSNYGVYVTGVNSTITSSGGAVDVTGFGGGAGASQNNIGVLLYVGGLVSSGGNGTVTVEGTGGSATGDRNFGVLVQGATITSNSNNVMVTGQGGGSGASSNNIGVYLEADGVVTAGGTGSVTVDGIGGAAEGGLNHGVYIANAGAKVTSGGGEVQVTGQGGGTGASIENNGVYLINGGQITAGGTGSVTVEGTGGATTGGSNYGVYVLGAGAAITSSDGNVQVSGYGGGSGAAAVNFGLFVANGGTITAGMSGTVTVEGTGGATGGNDNVGVYVTGAAALITSSGGAVDVTGFGGGAGSSAANHGVVVDYEGRITAGGMGTVDVHGTGGAATGNGNLGVVVSQVRSAITSAGGTVHVTGTGGGGASATSYYNYGVDVETGGVISAGLNGDVFVQGTGGAAEGGGNFGVYVSGLDATITSSGGDVMVTGQGGGTDASAGNYGIYVLTGGTITAGVNGTVTAQGMGGATTGSFNFGVAVIGINAVITSNNGDVTVTGVGGGTGLSGQDFGVYVSDSGLISAGMTGDVTVTGTGSLTAEGDSNYGVYVTGSNAAITSSGGNIVVTGTGGGTGAAITNYGVLVYNDASVAAGGSGTVTVLGTGGMTTGSENFGVWIGGSSEITSSSSITITGIEGSGTAGYALTLGDTGSIINTGSGPITLIGNSMSFDITSNINAGTGTVTIHQLTDGVAIDLGSAIDTVGGPLSLSEAELDRITAGELHIGDSNSGAITVSSDINLSTASTAGGGTVPVLCLTSGSTVTGTLGGIVVADLSIVAAGAVNFTDMTTNVTNLAISTTTGNVTFVEADGLTVTTVCGVEGISTAAGSVGLTSTTGHVTVANTAATNDISATTGITITLSANDAKLSTMAGSSIRNVTSGDITLSADKMDLGGTISASGQTVTLKNSVGADAINLGSAGDGASNTLELSDEELDRITASKLVIGDGNNGTVTISQAITRAAATDVTIATGSDIVFGAAGSIDLAGGDATLTAASGAIVGDATSLTNIIATKLTLTAMSGIGSANSLETMVDTLEFTNSTSGDVNVLETDALVVSGSNAGGGAVTITASSDVLTVAASGLSAGSGGGISLLADDMTIAGTVTTSGTVTLHQVTTGRAINLGTNDGVSLSLTDGELDQITAATLLIGDGDSGTVTLSAAITRAVATDVTLTTGSDIVFGAAGSIDLAGGDATLTAASGLVDGNAASLTNITAENLEIVAATGIGSGNAIETQVTNLAFRNTMSGGVSIANVGDLTLTSVGSLGGTAGHEIGNFGSGTTSVTATSRLTVAIETSSIGSMTLVAGEISDAPGFDQDLTINTGVSVSVSGVGSVLTLRAGDDVALLGDVTSAGNLEVTAGFNDLDNHGDITQNAAIHVTGTTLLSAPGDITLDNILNDFGGAVTITTATNATLADVNNITLSTTNTSGDLTVEAIGIHLTNTIAVGGQAHLDASSGAITDGSTSLSVTNLADFTGASITVGGAGSVTNFGSLAFHSPGAVVIQEDSSTAVTGASNAGMLTLSSTDDVMVSALVSVAGQTLISAGQDGSGSFVLAGTGHLVGDNAGNTANITINTGAASGNVTLTGTTTSDNLVTMNSAQSINGAGLVTAQTVDLNANTGIGNTTALELMATSISADTLLGNIDLDNASNSAVTFTSLTTGAGRITVDNDSSGGGSAAFTTVTSQDGTITLNVNGGRLTATTVTANGAGDVRLTTTTSGDVIVGRVTAAGNDVTITSAGQINDDANDALADIIAATTSLTAVSGIGVTGGSLDVDVTTVTSATAATGGVFLNLLDANNSGVTVTSATATTTGDVVLTATSGSGLKTYTNINARQGNVLISAASGNLVLGTIVSDSGVVDTHDVTVTATLGSITLNTSITSDDRVTLNAGVGGVTEQVGALISAAQLQLLGNGPFSLTGANTVGTLAAAVNGSIEYVNANSLIVGTVGATQGITTSDDDVTLCVTSGSLTLAQSLSTGSAGTTTGIVRLQTSGSTSQVFQSNGSITAASLGVRAGSGGISLNSSANDVDTLAATTTGSFSFVDADGFEIGTVAASGCFSPGVAGLTAGSDMEICVMAGDLAVSAALTASGSTIRLAAVNGSVTQSADGIITADRLGVSAGNDISLGQAANNVSGIFAANSTTSGDIEFNNLSGFTVGSVLASLGGCVPDVIGVTTTSGDITLFSAGGITVGTGAAERISASGRTIDIHAAGVSEVDGSIMNAANLRLRGTGSFTLAEANSVGTLAADIDGVLAYHDVDALIVGSVLGTNGLTTHNNDILLQADGNMSLNQSLQAGLADVRLSAIGNITQTASGTITADGLGVRQLSATGGEISLNADNDVNTFAASNAFVDGRVTYRDLDDLVVGTMNTQTIGQLTFGLTVGVSTNRGAVHVLTESGDLTLMQAVTTQGPGDILLETRGAAGDVILNAAVTSNGGHISLIAGDDVDQNANVSTAGGSIYVLAKNAIADALSGIDMQAGTSISTGGGNILLSAEHEGDIRLGLVNAGTGSVSLSAERSILNSGVSLNLQAAQLQMIADANHDAAGQIGMADVGNGTPGINDRAIKTQVATLAARAADGIYVLESDGITIDDTGSHSVTRVNFNAATDTVTTATLEDLTTTDNGPVKLVTQNGTIVIHGGLDATTGISAQGTGDVLLESRGTASDVIIRSAVRSGTGNLTLKAADDVEVSDTLTTGGGGTVFVSAANGTAADAIGPFVDGINLNAGVTTFSGDILISSARDIRQTALTLSTNGDVGLIALGHVSQTATGDITTTRGDVLVDAGGTWTMDGDTTITAGGGDVLGQAGEDILLGVIRLTNSTANRAALSAGHSILDANGASVNVTETVATSTTSLSLRATSGTIGATGGAIPTVNDNALDLNVDTVAAASAGGIYLRELAVGGAIEVNTAAAVTVDINDVLQANFNSTRTNVSQARTLAALEDLTTTANGSIQLLAENGSITVNSGMSSTAGVVAHGSGHLLLEARGTASDVVLNGAGVSGTGNISIIAGDDVLQNADLTTSGGSVYMWSGNGTADAVAGIRMANGTTTSSGGGNILLTAVGEGDLLLGRLNAGAGQVSLTAQRDILDNNGAAINVVADTLRMVADSNTNLVGRIGTPGAGAIDTTVTTLAAVSADGIDVLETDGLIVGDTGPITVQRVNVNSSLTDITVQSLSDLRTTDAGSITVVSTTGPLTVNEGSSNGTDAAGGVVAGTSGSVLLEATTGDLITNATVSSLTGTVTLRAGGDATVNALVTTETDVFVTAANDVDINENVTAGRDLSVTSTAANIDIAAPLEAGRNLSLNALVHIAADVPLHAGNAVTVTSGGTTSLTADADITTGAGGITMVVGQLTTAADFTTASGPISITGPVVLSGSVEWRTTAVGTGGDITVIGTLDGTSDQAENLILTSGTADISVTGNVGATTKLGDVLITEADETTFGGSFAAESFQQLAGQVTTFVGAVVTCGTVEEAGTDGFQFTGHSLQFSGGSASLDTTGQDITITTDALTLPTTFVNATGKTITIQTLSDATSIGLGDASQDLNFTDTQLDVIHSDNVVIGSATQTGGISIGTDEAITQDENYTLLTSASMQVNGLFQLDAAHTLLATIGTDLDITSGGQLETDRGSLTLDVARDIAVAGTVLTNTGELKIDALGDLTTTASGVIQSHDGAMLLTIGQDVIHAGRIETGSGPLTIHVADSMDVSGRIVSDQGPMLLDIGHDLRFGSTARVQSASGDITMIAGTATAACDGALYMADGAVIDAGSGLVSLTADDDITLGQVITTNSTVEAVRITSNCAAIIDGGDAGVANIVAESATARVSLQAVTGIGSAAGGGADAALETSVSHLDAVNASNHDVLVSGDIRIDEVDPNGLAIRQIDQQGAGQVAVTSQGTIVVTAQTEGGRGIHSRAGSILVSAENNSSDLDIRHTIDSTGGNITLLADNDVLIGEPGNGVTGQIQSRGGDIVVLADDDANADAGSGGELLMRDGAVLDAAGGTVELRADEDITLATIRTSNATESAITLVTRRGGIVDGGDTDRDIVADSDGAVVTISAATGIGSGNALETTIAALQATNSTAGHVRLNELNAIALVGITQSGGGRVDVITTDGTITVDNQGLATNAITVGGAGTLLLDANGTTSDIVVRDGIQTFGGNITLLADNDITFDAAGDVTTTSGNVVVTADQDNGPALSGQVVMANGAVLNAGAGTITITSDGSITLGSLQTTNATANAVRLTSREGGVIDGGDSHRDIIADATGAQVTILSAAGVGSTNALETTIASLSVTNSTTGNVRIDEQNSLAIQRINQQGGGTVVVTTQGTLTVAASGTGITSLGGSVTLTANGASSDVQVEAPITIIGGSGDITLTGSRDVVVRDTGVANDLWVAGTGEIRLTATSGKIVLGSQNPNTTPDSTQHTVANDVILRTATGAVTNTLPLVFNIQSPQVNALGEVFLNMDIGRPGEENLTVTVFWGDGTFTQRTFADPGNYTFTHRYFGNPNALDASAPILVNVQVAHDPRVVLTAQNVNTPVESVPDIGVLNAPPVPAQNINADLSSAIFEGDTRPSEAGPFGGADSKVFSAAGNVDNPGAVIFEDTTVKATAIPVPGTGMASFPFDVTPPVALLAIPEATRFLDILQLSGSQLSNSDSNRSELARTDDTQLAERLVTLEVLSPDNTVRQRVVLPETVLEDMLDVIGRLPDGKYRFQLQEPGEERQRLLLEFEVRQGKIADDTEDSDRPPSATKKKFGMTDGEAEVSPEGAGDGEAAVPDQSIMQALPAHESPGDALTPEPRAAGDSQLAWGAWSSIAARRAWKRAEFDIAPQPEPTEWSVEDAATETTAATSDAHTLAGSSVMLIGAVGLWAGVQATSRDDRPGTPQPSAKMSRAAQLFRKYARSSK